MTSLQTKLSSRRVGLVQMTSSNVLADNLDKIRRDVETLAAQGAALIVLPENMAMLGLKSYQQFAEQEQPLGKGPVLSFLADLCRRHHVWICAGTIPLASADLVRPRTTTVLLNAMGQISSCYQKVHLFDAQVADGQKIYRESLSYSPGRTLAVAETPIGRVGLTVCYDLRFPEMFQAYRRLGVQVMLVPAAFTEVTGNAHWSVLLRSRAIEHGMYIVSANQCGEHFNGRKTWGHSMVVDPWGQCHNEMGNEPGTEIVDLDLNYQAGIRSAMPVNEHRLQRISRNLEW